MTIAATPPGSTLVSSLRSQFRSVFDAAKKTYQETGQVSGLSAGYTSADGNVTIRLSGRTLSDGRQVLETAYSVGGAQGAALQKALTGGIDGTTGLPVSADTRYGAIGGSASSDGIGSIEDIDALERKITESALQTQDERDAQITQWGVGDGKYVSSREEYRAYNRMENAIADTANAITSKMKFKSPEEESEFYAGLNKALSKFMHEGDDQDLSNLLKGVSNDLLKEATKGLTGNDPSTEKLIKTLNDYMAARHAPEPSKGARPIQGLNMVV